MTHKAQTREERRLAERRRAQAQVRRKQTASRRVPWLLVAGGLLIALAVVMALQIKPAVAGTPRLVVSETDLDLGTQKYNTTARASFQIRNDGDGTLTLSVPDRPTVVEGCCPNKIELGQTRLNPGETTELYTDLMMHEGMGGKHLFEIVLNTNDRTRAAEKLTIKSDWVP